MNKKERILITVFIAVCVTLMPLNAETGIYTLGNKSGWNGLYSATQIAAVSGDEGCEAWAIAEREQTVTASTDVLLHFNNSYFVDEAGNYQVSAVDPERAIIAEQVKSRGECVLFRGNGGLVLKGGKRSLFGNQGLAGSFTVSFWLNPAAVDNGELILSWHSSRNLPAYSLYQMIIAGFENNHMNWLFTNVFDTYSEKNHTVEMVGKSVLVPGKWSYHELVYNADTGLLEYSVDGRLEDMCFVTDTGRETGTIYPARLGVVADLNLCTQYTGYLDDFIIERKAADTSVRNAALFDHYYENGGVFTTKVFEVSENGIKINEIKVNETVPEQTDTAYYIRWSNQPYGWTDTEPQWHEFSSNEDLMPQQAEYNRYFQIKGCLYTDGTASATPVVSGFYISYENRELPFAPYNIRAAAGDGSVTLSWKESPSGTSGTGTVGGYLIYYGERPGEYLGTCALEGSSPVDCGNLSSVKITGLTNGKMYYFAVCAYSGEQPVVYGPLSGEVYARPGSKKN